jgi:hypothetical protein
MPHFLTLPIQLNSVAPPFVGVAGIAVIVVDPEAIEGIIETETKG